MAAHEKLKSLHTALVDSRKGYEEALEDADGEGLTDLFRQMIELRTQHADEIATQLRTAGEPVDDKGSFMSTVHRAVISVRAATTGLGPSILPGLIDGEQRICSYYDEAIDESAPQQPEFALLAKQRDVVVRKIDEMKRQNDANDKQEGKLNV